MAFRLFYVTFSFNSFLPADVPAPLSLLSLSVSCFRISISWTEISVSPVHCHISLTVWLLIWFPLCSLQMLGIALLIESLEVHHIFFCFFLDSRRQNKQTFNVMTSSRQTDNLNRIYIKHYLALHNSKPATLQAFGVDHILILQEKERQTDRQKETEAFFGL